MCFTLDFYVRDWHIYSLLDSCNFLVVSEFEYFESTTLPFLFYWKITRGEGTHVDFIFFNKKTKTNMLHSLPGTRYVGGFSSFLVIKVTIL